MPDDGIGAGMKKGARFVGSETFYYSWLFIIAKALESGSGWIGGWWPWLPYPASLVVLPVFFFDHFALDSVNRSQWSGARYSWNTSDKKLALARLSNQFHRVTQKEKKSPRKAIWKVRSGTGSAVCTSQFSVTLWPCRECRQKEWRKTS